MVFSKYTKYLVLLAGLYFFSCGAPKDATGKKCYRKTKLILSATWARKVNDTYFELHAFIKCPFFAFASPINNLKSLKSKKLKNFFIEINHLSTPVLLGHP